MPNYFNRHQFLFFNPKDTVDVYYRLAQFYIHSILSNYFCNTKKNVRYNIHARINVPKNQTHIN